MRKAFQDVVDVISEKIEAAVYHVSNIPVHTGLFVREMPQNADSFVTKLRLNFARTAEGKNAIIGAFKDRYAEREDQGHRREEKAFESLPIGASGVRRIREQNGLYARLDAEQEEDVNRILGLDKA